MDAVLPTHIMCKIGQSKVPFLDDDVQIKYTYLPISDFLMDFWIYYANLSSQVFATVGKTVIVQFIFSTVCTNVHTSN